MFPLIDAHGTARERGRIHGAKAKQRVALSVANYARLFAFCGIDWRDAQRRGARFREAIGALGGELLEVARQKVPVQVPAALVLVGGLVLRFIVLDAGLGSRWLY